MELTCSYETAFDSSLLERYRWLEVRNASAIIAAVGSEARDDLVQVLEQFQLTAGDLLEAGGSKSQTARRLDEAFRVNGWRETHLTLSTVGRLAKQPWRLGGERQVQEVHVEFQGRTHKVDNFKDRVAIEVEWNAKDGNLDRDLSAFRALHEAGVIDAGIIVTRHHASVKSAATYLARRLSGAGMPGSPVARFTTTTTTNLEKLEWRLQRGDAGGCPVLAVGICDRTYTAGLPWWPSDGSAMAIQPPLARSRRTDHVGVGGGGAVISAGELTRIPERACGASRTTREIEAIESRSALFDRFEHLGRPG